MPDRIARAAGQPAMSPAQIVRCIIDSLAAAYASTVHRAAELASVEVDVIHLVGGGSQNELLCRLTAELAGLPVVAGPTEATAIGNVMVQARAHGAAPGTLEAIRARVAASTPSRRYHPS
jgi:rhamnulokinase